MIEVTPEGKIVWSIEQNELPGITLAWVTTLQVLPSGNIIVGNCHAGEANPQLFEVTRDKKVVWTFKDFKTFGNSLAAAQVLDLEGVLRQRFCQVMPDYRQVLAAIVLDPRYLANLDWGQPRSGHPEGKIRCRHRRTRSQPAGARAEV